ncbi:MAG TPA: hypothetical protein VJQ81_06305 [Reyranella sp.]|nr:hypothetical protein [Reyranella sp.]
MPIRAIISHGSRFVTAAAEGKVTRAEVDRVVADIAEAHAASYARVIDVRRATIDMPGRDLLACLEPEATRPTALVADSTTNADTTVVEGDCAVALFETTNEAVEWVRSERLAQPVDEHLDRIDGQIEPRQIEPR